MAKLNFNKLGYIEEGTHLVDFKTIQNELTFSSRRLTLLNNLENFLKEYYCDNKLIDAIYILGSFASRKKDPSDIDLAIKLNEEVVNSSSHTNSIFRENTILQKFEIQLVYIELEDKNLANNLPISEFATKSLYLFRRLKFEEKKKISIEERNPNFEFDKEDKGVLQIYLQDFCL